MDEKLREYLEKNYTTISTFLNLQKDVEELKGILTKLMWLVVSSVVVGVVDLVVRSNIHGHL